MSALRGASLPEISIIIPTLHRVDQLRRCLESLTTQRNAPSWQLVISAPPDAAVQAMIREIVPSATIVEVGKGAPALRRNAVLSHARGDLLLFLDDDVIVPDHYLHSLDEQQRQYPDIDVFGGPNLTPPGSSYFQVVQGAVLSLSSAPVRYDADTAPARRLRPTNAGSRCATSRSAVR